MPQPASITLIKTPRPPTPAAPFFVVVAGDGVVGEDGLFEGEDGVEGEPELPPGEDGVEGLVEPDTVTASFIPCEQCPAVPQTKYRVPDPVRVIFVSMSV